MKRQNLGNFNMSFNVRETRIVTVAPGTLVQDGEIHRHIVAKFTSSWPVEDIFFN